MKRWVITLLTVLASLLPLAWLGYLAAAQGLGANDWALRLLLLTLAITPLQRLIRRPIMVLRRPLGLAAFAYALLHFIAYVALESGFDLASVWEDILERPYITVGVICLSLLFPLALTSTDGMVRRLGRNWRRLHRLVYPAALLAVLHFYMMTRADWREPLLYAVILALLLGMRRRS